MQVNLTKCGVMRLGRIPSTVQYRLGGMDLVMIDSITDLGIHTMHTLSASLQTNVAVNKAHSVMHCFRHSFIFIFLVYLVEARMRANTQRTGMGA